MLVGPLVGKGRAPDPDARTAKHQLRDLAMHSNFLSLSCFIY